MLNANLPEPFGSTMIWELETNRAFKLLKLQQRQNTDQMHLTVNLTVLICFMYIKCLIKTQHVFLTPYDQYKFTFEAEDDNSSPGQHCLTSALVYNMSSNPLILD